MPEKGVFWEGISEGIAEKLEGIIEFIPLLGSYLRRENDREVDKLIREHIAERFDGMISIEQDAMQAMDDLVIDAFGKQYQDEVTEFAAWRLNARKIREDDRRFVGQFMKDVRNMSYDEAQRAYGQMWMQRFERNKAMLRNDKAGSAFLQGNNNAKIALGQMAPGDTIGTGSISLNNSIQIMCSQYPSNVHNQVYFIGQNMAGRIKGFVIYDP